MPRKSRRSWLPPAPTPCICTVPGRPRCGQRSCLEVRALGTSLSPPSRLHSIERLTYRCRSSCPMFYGRTLAILHRWRASSCLLVNPSRAALGRQASQPLHCNAHRTMHTHPQPQQAKPLRALSWHRWARASPWSSSTPFATPPPPPRCAPPAPPTWCTTAARAPRDWRLRTTRRRSLPVSAAAGVYPRRTFSRCRPSART